MLSARFLIIVCLLAAFVMPGCGNPPREAKNLEPVPQQKNVPLQSHVAPECYRFDAMVRDAQVVAAPPADDSTFAYRFDYKTETVPWTIAEGSAECAVKENALTIETKTAARCDSPVVGDISVTATEAIIFDARVSGCSRFGFAFRSPEGEFPKKNETTIDVGQTAEWARYTILTNSFLGWNSGLRREIQFRLILPENAKMEIRSISLAQKMDPFAGRSYGQLDFSPKSKMYVHTLFARTPCSLDYELSVMPSARLTTGLLLAEAVPTRFRILLLDGAEQASLVEEQVSVRNTPLEVSADLSKWAGKKVRVRFEAESERPGSLALWSTPTVARPYPVTEAKRPLNVIWYVIDCLRATNVSAYGYSRETTRALDEVAKEGVRFEWCFSPGSWTVDSVASFFTGLSPNAHGLLRGHPSIPESMQVLPDILRNAGYSTALFTQNPYLDNRLGFIRGFDEAQRYRVRGSRSRKGGTAATYPINVAIGSYLKEHKESPMFIYVHTIEPHGPYVPPSSLRVFGQPDGSVGTADLYDDCILWADGNLENTIRILKEEGLWNNTLLIVSADHGQSFPEYDSGLEGHGEQPYLSRVRIPLVMRLPGILPQGAVVEENVQALDIPRTLFELLHMEPSPQFEGQSLMGFFDEARKGAFEQRSIFPSGQHSKWQAVVKGRWFFLDNDGKGELLDLETAPQQSANVIEAHPDLAQQFLAETQKFREAEAEKAKQYKDDSSRNVEIDPEDRKSLEAMGYL